LSRLRQQTHAFYLYWRGAAGDLFKWIDDLYALDHLAVIHVFG
jgi:hypothetical protein